MFMQIILTFNPKKKVMFYITTIGIVNTMSYVKHLTM